MLSGNGIESRFLLLPKGLVYSPSPPALPIDWLIESTSIPGHELYSAHKQWKDFSDLHRFNCFSCNPDSPCIDNTAVFLNLMRLNVADTEKH